MRLQAGNDADDTIVITELRGEPLPQTGVVQTEIILIIRSDYGHHLLQVLADYTSSALFNHLPDAPDLTRRTG